MWVCTSTPPGMTYLPLASMTLSQPCSDDSNQPGAPTAAIFSPSINTSLAITPVGEMTNPFLINTLAMMPPLMFGEKELTTT